MDDQGGAGGVPLHGDDDASRRRAPHVKPRAGKTGAEDDGTTRAADTDEASRLDRPAGPTAPGERPHRWKGPEE